MSSFGGTLTGGIQDMSALLPLLGTEQCEDHVGSALLGGYLYAAVAPLSIFGSLGIVRAGAKALAASCSLEVCGTKIMGAEKVNDAGFSQAGKVLSLIMWDGRRHLAEKQLISILDRLHITNVAGLTVKAEMLSWNLKMLILSIIAVFASLTPYIYLFNVGTEPFSMQWLLPLARSVGSLFISNLIQVVIQVRLLEIIKHQIVFMTVDDSIRTSSATGVVLPLPEQWNPRVSSEVALYHLARHLKAHRDGSPSEMGGEIALLRKAGADANTDEVKKDIKGNMSMLQSNLDAAMTMHSLPTTKLYRSMLAIARVFIFLGLGLSVIGYIGSFSLVQTATPIHTLIWLVLEISLSLVRIFLWSLNPKGDETALTFSLELSYDRPLPTCNKFSEELDEEGIVPLTRSDKFLREITSFVGLLEPLEGIREGVALYYTMTVCEKSNRRVLYVTIFDYKERISRTLKHDPTLEKMICRTATIEVEDGEDGISRVQAKMGKEVDMEGHHLTGEQTLLLHLKKHCDSILDKLSQAGADRHVTKKHTFLTWAKDLYSSFFLRGFQSGASSPHSASQDISHPRSHDIKLTWALTRNPAGAQGAQGDASDHITKWLCVSVLKQLYHTITIKPDASQAPVPDSAGAPSPVKLQMPLPEGLTADMAYLQTGKLERARRHFWLERSQWVSEYSSFSVIETLAQIPTDPKRNRVIALCEAAIAECFILYEWQSMEELLVEETKELENILLARNEIMLTNISEALRSRMLAELQDNLKHRIVTEANSVKQRLSRLGEEARKRIREQQYSSSAERSLEWRTKSVRKGISDAWDDLVRSVKEKQLFREQLGLRRVTAPGGSDLTEFAKNVFPEIERFIGDTRDEIEKTIDPEVKGRRLGDFKKVKIMSQERLKRVNDRLSNEWQMMKDRLELTAEARNVGLLPEYYNFKDFKGSSTALLALSTSKYVQLDRGAIAEIGIAATIWALEQNTILSCIDCTDCSFTDILKIIPSLKRVKSVSLILARLTSQLSESTEDYHGEFKSMSVTEFNEGNSPEENINSLASVLCENQKILSIDLQRPLRPEFAACISAVQGHIQASAKTASVEPTIFYQSVHITDYQGGKPSLLFGKPGSSTCIILFSPPTVGAMSDDGTRKMKLRLEQCQAASSYTPQVDIYLDGEPLPWDRNACPKGTLGIQEISVDVPFIVFAKAGEHQARIFKILEGPDDNFGIQNTPVGVPPDIHEALIGLRQVHVLMIRLRDDADDVHWLLDVHLLWP